MDPFSCACELCAADERLRPVHRRWRAVFSLLTEHQARLFAADKALELGHDGARLAARILDLSPRTVQRGIHELQHGIVPHARDRMRQPGGGRKRCEEVDAGLLAALEALLEETTAGDPMALLRWTSKSLRALAEQLQRQGHPVSHGTVRRLLHGLHYSLRGNVKALGGQPDPRRDAQFCYIHDKAKEFVEAQLPVISVDAKKKELVGEFANRGRQWRQEDRLVNAYDFPSLAEGPAFPYGIYDEEHNEGFVNVGMDHDTAAFAVASIGRWWSWLGREHYPEARKLLITADSGGSNGNRPRLWKTSLQRFADSQRLDVTVCHYPRGTSKWNKVEHRLFSFISMNWRGEPLTSYETVIELISHTTTRKGLQVFARLDEGSYPTKIKVTDKEMAQVQLERHALHPNWNYTIRYHR